MTFSPSRRTALFTAAALPLMAAGMAIPSRAASEMQGARLPGFYRFRLGTFEVTTLLAGARTGDKPQETFGLNASPEEFAALSAANAIPADRQRSSFSPVLVNTGSALILFDTGLAAPAMVAALSTAGQSAESIDIVVLTHMHGDHIGGLMSSGAPTFPNARYVCGQAEYDYWAGAKSEAFDTNVRPLAAQMTYLDDGDTVVPGITAMLTAGHTPGHMAFRVESDGAAMLIAGDITNHYVWSLARPAWEVRFDNDKAMAIAVREKVLAQLADERLLFTGYHMPFPALGYVLRDGDTFRFAPVTYQLMLDEA